MLKKDDDIKDDDIPLEKKRFPRWIRIGLRWIRNGLLTCFVIFGLSFTPFAIITLPLMIPVTALSQADCHSMPVRVVRRSILNGG